MRLRDILAVFSRYSKDIILIESGIANDSNNSRIEGISRFRIAIQQIENTGAFKKELEDIKNINKTIFVTYDDSIALSKDISRKLVSLSTQLQNKLNISASVLSAILPPQDQNSISIKLPTINGLTDLSDISRRLDKVFNQLLANDFVDGKVTLQNFDTGSKWFEIVFNTTKAASVFVSVIYAAIFLHGEYIKNQEAIEVVRNRKITNDLYENYSNKLLDIMEEERKKQLDKQAKKISKEAGADENDNEYNQMVKLCITEIDELVKSGIKFFPSSTSPSEIKRIFPDFSKNSIEEMLPEVKRLPEKTSESTTTEESKS